MALNKTCRCKPRSVALRTLAGNNRATMPPIVTMAAETSSTERRDRSSHDVASHLEDATVNNPTSDPRPQEISASVSTSDCSSPARAWSDTRRATSRRVVWLSPRSTSEARIASNP